MKKLMKKTAMVVAVGAMISTATAPAAFAQDLATQNISGNDRFSTAVKI